MARTCPGYKDWLTSLPRSPSKLPSTYTRVKHFRPNLGSFLGGRLIRGSTCMRVYTVGRFNHFMWKWPTPVVAPIYWLVLMFLSCGCSTVINSSFSGKFLLIRLSHCGLQIMPSRAACTPWVFEVSDPSFSKLSTKASLPFCPMWFFNPKFLPKYPNCINDFDDQF